MDALAAACEALFGAAPLNVARLHGGDLSKVARVTLASGAEVVAKEGPMVDREARMVAAIAEAGVPAPQVLGLSDDVLFLEHLEEVRPGAGHWAQFGADLARLHATTGTSYGWGEDYTFGPAMIYNARADDWPRFWAERRLLPFVAQMERGLGARVEALADRLDDLLPATPPPALLHGDLWTGNLLATKDAIHLIDPACYHGHAEVDLAMLHLFGGPGPGFADAYGALEPGWEVRRAVYSLFPALVHLTLFGAGYRPMVAGFLAKAGQLRLDPAVSRHPGKPPCDGQGMAAFPAGLRSF